MKILIAVTHLLGIGHFARMRVLARGLVASGHEVTLISGGRPQPHLDGEGFTLVQLPPVHCTGTDFSTLYEADGIALSDATRTKRVDLMTKTLNHMRPDIVVTETFPFGRRALKQEFLALCECAAALRPRPAIVASIRDLLNPPSSPAKAGEAEQWVARYYDAVLVHGDAALVPPQMGWPFGRCGTRALRLTGYIDETQISAASHTPHNAILVSGGGSAASLQLYRATLDAARRLPTQQWHVLIGHGVAQDDFDALCADAPASVTIERARKDFRALLAGARLSVSQAGYNTIVDLFATQTPMVLVPFAAGQEQEQTLRARVLQDAGLATLVSETELKGETLARAVTQALALPRSSSIRINLDGVAGSMAALATIQSARAAIEAAWQGLEAQLAQLKARGESISFWWRDDDAVEPTPQLTRLLQLSHEMNAPVALAVIPAQVSPDLVEASGDAAILIHGVAHQNHAPADRKKQELGFQPVDIMVDALRKGRDKLATLFGQRALPVLVPPWNRIDPTLVARLHEAGISGLSTYKRRAAVMAARDVMQINTHCDPIDWRHGGGLGPEAQLVNQITALIAATLLDPADAREPIGLLSHHLVHDEAIWAFLTRLLRTLGRSGAVRFTPATIIFDKHQMVPPPIMVE